MAKRSRSSRAIACVAALSLAALSGCGVSPAYTPVRTPVAVPDPVVDAPPPPVVEQAETTGYEDTDAAALSDFHETLAPYGAWEEDAVYGTVWVPASDRVGADFAPYKSAGHWELDEREEWLWVSDHDDTFGWVVYHYGRWAYTDARGWVWIPGRRYAPAWVTWQAGDPGYGYVGWAPMPPAYYWRSGAVIWLDVYPAPAFVYCSSAYVFHHDWHHYAVPHSHVVAVATPMHPHGVPRGGHVYAQPHRGPTMSSGVVPRDSYPTSRHRMAEGPSRYATPSGGGGLGGSSRPGSRSRPSSFDGPGDGRAPRSLGASASPGGISRPDGGGPRSFAERGDPAASRGAFGPSRSAGAPSGARMSAPSEGNARAPSHVGPSRMPSAPSAPPASFSRPSSPSSPSAFSRPSSPSSPPSSFTRPSAPSSFSSPGRSASPSTAPMSTPSRAPSFSAPARAPSFSTPSRSSTTQSASPVRAPSGGVRGRR